MPGVRPPTPEQVRSWRGTGHPYKLIAAAIAEWAAGRERGTVVPDDGFFGIEASGSTYQRAKRFLVEQGVLRTSDGPFQVALQGSRPSGHLPRMAGRVRGSGGWVK
jgi:hypothetical protein